MHNALISFSNDLSETVRTAGFYVVAVQARARIASSGLIWQPGVIVTAEHAVRRHDDIRVTLPDGKVVMAALVGRDPGTDLAVLKVEGATADRLTLADASHQAPGQVALAVGRSPEYGVTASLGIISGLGGPWHTWRGGRLDRFIRLDLGLHPAASGGGVIDAWGKLVGIATAGLTRTAAVAVPTETVDRVVNALLTIGHVARGYLGVGLQPVRLPDHLTIVPKGGSNVGLIVLSVEPESPAEKGGMLIGDTLLALEGSPVSDTDDVLGLLGPESVGRTMRILALRAGERKELVVTIGERARTPE